ncbi:prostaglandin E synthase 2 [Daktulosphaira vitifoliae]|uniref:prostaglandin E synthase 2 n=1 Tax=Daktulosphaira vitifoliae TaxID=58002 RepID=UPI0021A9C20D|nr:prostaglandin E synthase 2 [Daktulosphaira vitifoliae]
MMALRLAIRGNLNFSCLITRPVVFRMNQLNRFKHFDNRESPISKQKKQEGSILRTMANGIAIGVAIGIGYYYFTDFEKKLPGSIVNTPTTVSKIQKLPEIKITREVHYHNEEKADFILFQYPTCPFCCKVRAFLDYFKISYNIVEVDPMLKQQISWSSYKKVPILLVKLGDGYIPLTDSTMIISAMTTYLKDPSVNIQDIANYYPSVSFVDTDGKRKSEIMNKYFIMNHEESIKDKQLKFDDERKWRKWSDEVLVHSLSPNAYRSLPEAIDSFKWFSVVGQWEKNFPLWETILMIYGGAFMMWIISKKLKKKYKLKDDVRQSLYDDCNIWMNEVKKKGETFMGGKKPNLADLAVYGILSSIEGCMAFEDACKKTDINIWYSNMKAAIN